MSETQTPQGRIIGIRHRVKKTAAGETRPTQIAIIDGDNTVRYDIEDETGEKDFLLGIFPVKFRKVREDEDLTAFKDHHIVWRKLKKSDEWSVPENLRKTERKQRFEAEKVPAAYEGYRAGDTVVSVLGGSGDRFMFALSKRGEEIGAIARRIPGYLLKSARDRAAGEKDDDPEILAQLATTQPDLFYTVTRRDRDHIKVREILKDRVSAMRERIGAEQRLLQRTIGKVFCTEDGRYPEGNLEDMYKGLRANDVIVTSLEKEEGDRIKELTAAIEALVVYREVLHPVEGCGPLIAAPIIAAITDIRRFGVKPDEAEIARLRGDAKAALELGNYEGDKNKVEQLAGEQAFLHMGRVAAWKRENGKTDEAELILQAIDGFRKVHILKRKAFESGEAKLKAFMGVHVRLDGTFPRARRERKQKTTESEPETIADGEDEETLDEALMGAVEEAKATKTEPKWNRAARQAVFLLVDQFVKRPDSEWGIKQREYKKRFRVTHPDVVIEKGKKRYTDGHIHKMSIWRTATKWVEWLNKAWWDLENRTTVDAIAPTPPKAPSAAEGSGTEAPITPESVLGIPEAPAPETQATL